MSDSQESVLRKKVMLQLLKMKVEELVREECEECVNDWPSQTDHETLMNRASNAIICMDRAIERIKPWGLSCFGSKRLLRKSLL